MIKNVLIQTAISDTSFRLVEPAPAKIELGMRNAGKKTGKAGVEGSPAPAQKKQVGAKVSTRWEEKEKPVVGGGAKKEMVKRHVEVKPTAREQGKMEKTKKREERSEEERENDEEIRKAQKKVEAQEMRRKMLEDMKRRKRVSEGNKGKPEERRIRSRNFHSSGEAHNEWE